MEPRNIQRLMAASGYYNGGIDGDIGSKSLTAIRLILERNKPEATKWSATRQRNAVGQIILKAAGYYHGAIDGWAGDLTREAFNEWDYFVTTGKREVLPGREEPSGGTVPKPSASRWPKQNGVRAFFGEAGGPDCTSGQVILPFAFRLAWNKVQKVSKVGCHRLVAEAFTTIWGEAARHYGEAEFRRLGLDLYGGCYNYRPMRGGSSLSMHSWGIAWDVDPERNQLRWGGDQAAMAGDDYKAFWRIVQGQGGISLGQERNYDWMHFQFATLK